MAKVIPIVPCLWFDKQAEDAVRYYTSIFKNSRITQTSHFGEAGKEIHGQPPGLVMTVEFELDGHRFTALNGGPNFKFSEAVSFQVMCDTQEEIDYYWEKLREGGDPKAQQCGWLKDKFGMSWQVVWTNLPALLGDQKTGSSQKAMLALMEMKKVDIKKLEEAARS